MSKPELVVNCQIVDLECNYPLFSIDYYYNTIHTCFIFAIIITFFLNL